MGKWEKNNFNSKESIKYRETNDNVWFFEAANILDIVERENKAEKEGERERDTCILTNEGKQR